MFMKSSHHKLTIKPPTAEVPFHHYVTEDGYIHVSAETRVLDQLAADRAQAGAEQAVTGNPQLKNELYIWNSDVNVTVVRHDDNVRITVVNERAKTKLEATVGKDGIEHNFTWLKAKEA